MKRPKSAWQLKTNRFRSPKSQSSIGFVFNNTTEKEENQEDSYRPYKNMSLTESIFSLFPEKFMMKYILHGEKIVKNVLQLKVENILEMN